MKHNKEFIIKIEVEAGTNAEMSKEEFHEEICSTLYFAEQAMNKTSKVRFHMTVKDEDLRIVNKWTPEKTKELVERIKNLGNKDDQ